MIKYSILDNTREELSSNITVRLDDTYFKGTIITYDPIKLIDDKIHYSIIFHILTYNGIEKEAKKVSAGKIKWYCQKKFPYSCFWYWD